MFIDVSILGERRTFASQFENLRRKVSKTVSPPDVPRKDDGSIGTTGLHRAVDAAPYLSFGPTSASRPRSGVGS